MSEVRNTLKWADGKVIKSEIEIQVLSLLGPKTEEDLAPPPKAEKVAKPSKPTKPSSAVKENNGSWSKLLLISDLVLNVLSSVLDLESDSALTITELMKKVNFHKPGENFKTDGYVITDKTMDLLKKHLEVTGGQVMQRTDEIST